MRLEPHNFDGSILLAVSGGVDSVVMAHCMCHGKVNQIAIAHCNFHLRGEESDGDEAFVKAFAERLGLVCYTADFDTLAYARENGISVEMAARELRYRWFDELCHEYGFDGVAVAHNANDNAETLMLNLLRGTGLRGIKGMESQTRNPYGSSKVFRPMLDIPRADIEAYAKENGLEWRTDSTNLESDCKRNILRNEVFPIFERINPAYIATLNRDIRNFRSGDNDIVEQMLEAGFNGASIDSALDLMQSERTVSGKRFYSRTHVMAMTADGPVFEAIDGRKGGCRAKVELIGWDGSRSPKTSVGITLVDADKVGDHPVIRRWDAGDYMYPIGLKGRKKVSDILTDLKLNVLEKDRVLVLDGGDHHVLAVIGYRVDEGVKICEKTTRVYRISLI